jgi:hypothetical protein
MTEEKEKLFVMVYQQPNVNGRYYIVDLDNAPNVSWLKGKLGIETINTENLDKRISALERARYNLQKVALPQLIEACKLEMMGYIESNYKDKAFKDAPVRDKFDDWYGWEACFKALQGLVEEDKLTYKRGWYRLPKVEAGKVGETTEKAEVTVALENTSSEEVRKQ